MRITRPLYLAISLFFHKIWPSHLPQMRLLPEVPIIMSMNYQSISNGEEKAYHPIWNAGPASVFTAHVCEIVPKQWQSATRSIYACRARWKHHKKKKNPAGVQTFSGSVLQINRNLTNFFTLSAVNLRPPPSTLSTHTQERGRTSKIWEYIHMEATDERMRKV